MKTDSSKSVLTRARLNATCILERKNFKVQTNKLLSDMLVEAYLQGAKHQAEMIQAEVFDDLEKESHGRDV